MIDRAEFRRRYRPATARATATTWQPMPGVVDLIADIAGRGLPLGVASSSSSQWVEEHLVRVGLRDHFDAIVGFDRTGVGKPAPDVYVAACDGRSASTRPTPSPSRTRPTASPPRKAAGLPLRRRRRNRITAHIELRVGRRRGRPTARPG